MFLNGTEISLDYKPTYFYGLIGALFFRDKEQIIRQLVKIITHNKRFSPGYLFV